VAIGRVVALSVVALSCILPIHSVFIISLDRSKHSFVSYLTTLEVDFEGWLIAGGRAHFATVFFQARRFPFLAEIYHFAYKATTPVVLTEHSSKMCRLELQSLLVMVIALNGKKELKAEPILFPLFHCLRF
jgi:hypothetical protein